MTIDYNAQILWAITVDLARAAKIDHHFSPEYMFASLFTLHYDRFAEYLPVFGQLREFSKICAAINILGNVRKGNKESILKLKEALVDSRKQTQNFISRLEDVLYGRKKSDIILNEEQEQEVVRWQNLLSKVTYTG
ncbi:hypothetical protein NOVO_05490 [Rickettsiales bacterium Ac37b]|nr:hypothetical protein NOVO_05490 [Rickettsiales bacterium Ac37b]